jgi:hypothetical protein
MGRFPMASEPVVPAGMALAAIDPLRHYLLLGSQSREERVDASLGDTEAEPVQLFDELQPVLRLAAEQRQDSEFQRSLAQLRPPGERFLFDIMHCKISLAWQAPSLRQVR